jgi:RNA polymerase sigma factor (sigma-70 family)
MGNPSSEEGRRAAQPLDVEELVRTHARRLRNFVRRRVGNPQDVDDLVQETCMEAIRCADKFQGHSLPETWLFGIAMNLMRNFYKNARMQSIFDYNDADKMPDTLAEDTLDTVARHQLLDRFRRVLDKLSPETQLILELVFDTQCSYEEAAAILGIPVGTVRSRISRARDLLKKHLR